MIFFPPVGIPLMFKFMKKPSKRAKIIISVIWSIFWIFAMVSSALDSRREFDINGNKVTIQCASYCTYIDEYAGKDALKQLATMGITEVKVAPSTANSGKADIMVVSPQTDTERLTLELAGGKLFRIVNTTYPSVVYYSENSQDKVAKYPGTDEINALKAKKAAEEEARKKAEEADRVRKEQEEAARKAEEAKVPNEVDTAVYCKQAFELQYPYNGSKVHSILGVIANVKNSANSRLYKVEVTIQNAFGAERSGVMECVVQKDGDALSLKEFNVY